MKVSTLARSSSDRRRRVLRRILVGSIAAAATVHLMSAASLTWDANGTVVGIGDGDGFWNIAGNQNWRNGGTNQIWVNSDVPNPDDATFGSGGNSPGVVQVSSGVKVHNITFATAGPRYSLVNLAAGAFIQFVGTAPTITTNTDATLAMVVSGTGFTKAGSKRLIWQGQNTGAASTNTYTGLVSVTAGTLQIGGNFAPEGAIRDNLTIGSGGLLQLSQSDVFKHTANVNVDGYASLGGFSAQFGGLTGTGVISSAFTGSTITLGNNSPVGANSNFGGTIRGPVSLVVSGSDGSNINGAVQTLSGVNTFTGSTTINAATATGVVDGSLTLANGLALYLSPVRLNANNGLKFTTGTPIYTIGSLSGAGNLTLGTTTNSAITLQVGNSTATATYTGVLSNAPTGTSGFTKIGTGTQILAPAAVNTYTGSTTVNGGILQLDYTNPGLAAPTNLVNSASTLRLGGGTLNIKAASSGTTSQTFSSLTVNAGGGGLSLTPNSGAGTSVTFSQAWNRSAGGTLNIDLSGGSSTINTVATGQLTNNVILWGAVTDASGTGFATESGGQIVKYDPTIHANGAKVTTESAITSATTNYDVDFDVSPSLTLSGARTGNTLRAVSSGTATLDLSASPLTLNGLMGAAFGTLTIQSSGAGKLNIGSTNSLAIHLAAGNLTIAAPIVNNGGNASSVTIQSSSPSSLLTLSGANTYSGGTYLNGGTTVVKTSSVGQPGALTSGAFGTGTLTFGGGSLRGDISGGAITIGNNVDFLRDVSVSSGVGLNFTGNVTLLDGMRTFSTSSANAMNFAGAIADGTGAAGLTLNGGFGGLVVFGGNNTYTGVTQVKTVTLQIGNDGTTGTFGTGPVYFDSTLSFHRTDDLVVANELTGTGSIEQAQPSTLFLANSRNNVSSLLLSVANATIDVGAFGLTLNSGAAASGILATNSGTVKASGVGGALTLDTTAIFRANDTKTLTISAPIQDGLSNSIRITGAGGNLIGTVALTGQNTYTGPTVINSGIVSVNSLNSVATNLLTGTVHSASSNLGSPTTVANGAIQLGSNAILRYNGTGETTDRLLTPVGNGTFTVKVEQNGTGILKFLGADTGVNTGGGVLRPIINLSGSTSGIGVFAGNAGPSDDQSTIVTSLVKSGTGTWQLTGTNTYLGSTTVANGTLELVNATNPAAPILPNTAILNMRGGTLRYDGSAGIQVTQGLVLQIGANVIDVRDTGAGSHIDTTGQNNGQTVVRTSVTNNINIGTVDFRNSAGTLDGVNSVVDILNNNDVSGSGAVVATTTINGVVYQSGIIGPWATMNSGATLVSNSNGNVAGTKGVAVPFQLYFNLQPNANIAAAGNTGIVGPGTSAVAYGTGATFNNVRFNTNYAATNGMMTMDPSIIVRTLTQNSNQALTLDMGTAVSPKTLRVGNGPTSGLAVGAIYITPTGKSLTVGTAPGLGVLTTGVGTNNLLAEIILGNFSMTSALTINANIANFPPLTPVRLTMSGPGVVTLAGNNTFVGGVNLFSGTLNVNNPNALGYFTATQGGLLILGGALDNTSGAPVTVINGKTINLGGDFTFIGTNPLSFGNGGINITDQASTASNSEVRTINVLASTLAFGGVISGSGAATLVKTGPGELGFRSDSGNTFTGGLIVKQGVVSALNDTTTFGTGDIILGDTAGNASATLAGGSRTLAYTNDILVTAGNAGAMTIRNALDAATNFSGTITLNHDLTFGTNGFGSTISSGSIAGTGTVTVAAGSNVTNFVGFTGGNGGLRSQIVVSSGLLRIGSANSLGDAAIGTNVLSGGSLDLNGQTVSEPLVLNGKGVNSAGALINTSAVSSVANGNIFLAGDASIGGAGNLTVNGAITGAPALVKVGKGAVVLNGINTYEGLTVVQNGSLTADMTAASSVLNPVSSLGLAGGTFQLNGAAGAARTQVMNQLFVFAGENAVVVNNTGTATTLDLRSNSGLSGIGRSGGTVDFRATVPGSFGTTAQVLTAQANDATGILGAWATVNNGAALATNNGGVITAYTGYADLNALGPNPIPNNPSANARINAQGTTGNVSLGAATTDVNTLTQNFTTASTVDTSAGTLRMGAIGGIYITPGSAALTIGTSANSGNLTAGGNVTNGAGGIILDNNSASALTINAKVTDNGSGKVYLVKAGSGALTLNGANTFTDGITLQSGTLRLGNAAALGSTVGDFYILGGTVDNSTGAALSITGKRQVWAGDFAFAGTNQLTFTGGGVVLLNSKNDPTRTLTLNGAALNIAGEISGGMSLTKTGSGDLNLSGAASTFTGGLNVLSGNVTATDANGTFGTGPILLGDGVSAANVTLAAGLRTAGYDNQIITAGGGSGTLTIRALANSTLSLNGAMLLNGNLTLSTTASSNGNLTLNGLMSGVGNLTISAGSKLGNVVQINGDNINFLGNTTIAGGTVKMGAAYALGAITSSKTISAGAALDVNGQNLPNTIVLNGSGINGRGVLLNSAVGTVSTVSGTIQMLTPSTFGGDGSMTFLGAVGGTSGAAFTKEGDGTVTLTVVNSYNGPTNVRNGTLNADFSGIGLTNVTTLNIINSASVLQMNGGTFQMLGIAVGARTQPFASTQIQSGSSSIIVNNPSSQVTTIDVKTITRTGGSVDFRNIGGAFGTSSRQLTNTSNDASGIIGVWATVSNGNAFAINNGSGVVAAYAGYDNIAALGSTLADDVTSNTRINSVGTSGNITLTGATTNNINSLTQTSSALATVDTTGKVLRVGAVGGLLLASTANTLQIGTAAGVGTLTAGGADNTAGELLLSNFSTGADILVNSNVTNNGSGAVTVSKVNLGSATLAGTNTYTGPTKVEAGTLFVTGSISGSITTVHSDAILGGTGTLGTVNVALAGNIAPGVNGIGTLHTGALTLGDSADFLLELGGKAVGQYDRIQSTSITLGELNAGPSLIASFVNGYVPQPGDAFTIMLNDGAGAIGGTFASGSTLSMNNGAIVFNINYAGGDGNDVVLTVAVPEPGTAGLLLGAAAPLLGLRRFRRRR